MLRMSDIIRPSHLMVFFVGFTILGCTTIHPVTIKDVPSVEENLFTNEHFDNVLQLYVNEQGLINYSELRKHSEDLDIYYYLVATYSPDSHPNRFPTQNHKLAYWINAYNSSVIKTVLTHYPIDTVLEVKQPAILFFLSDKSGFFFFQRLVFGGRTTSLYYLENQVIRKRFGDPRIHFALNCASLGCPRLPRQSFSGDSLDHQLDREARLFLAEKRNFNIDHNEKAIYLSSIFQWFEKDFTGWYANKFPDRKTSLLGYLDLYLTPEKSEELKKISDSYPLRFIPYDWRLNDQGAS